jgi:hypothetical protein
MSWKHHKDDLSKFPRSRGLSFQRVSALCLSGNQRWLRRAIWRLRLLLPVRIHSFRAWILAPYSVSDAGPEGSFGVIQDVILPNAHFLLKEKSCFVLSKALEPLPKSPGR